MNARLRRRLWLGWGFAAVSAALALAALAAIAGYEAGRAQLELERDRALAEAGRVREHNRVLVERLARAEERLALLERRYARLEEAYRRRALEPRYAELLRLIRRREAEGVPLERLRWLIDQAGIAERCEETVEVQRLFVRVPLARGQRSTAALAGGRITVRLVGTPARDAEGRVEAWYDPEQPVEMIIQLLDGRRQTLRGPLPLLARVVVGDRAYRLAAQPGERRGYAQIAAQRCAYP